MVIDFNTNKMASTGGSGKKPCKHLDVQGGNIPGAPPSHLPARGSPQRLRTGVGRPPGLWSLREEARGTGHGAHSPPRQPDTGSGSWTHREQGLGANERGPGSRARGTGAERGVPRRSMGTPALVLAARPAAPVWPATPRVTPDPHSEGPVPW